jgi:transposase InsO family protein
MIPLAEREQILRWVDEACAQGARREPACTLLGISVRTLQRWRDETGTIDADGRCQRTFVPANKLTDAEREQMLAIANRAEFAALPPSQFVPMLAERGEYIASESSFYRVLREAKQLNHRLASRPATHHKPAPLQASAPNELYSWDITYLKTPLAGVYFYLYLVMDIYSRKIVGWCVQEHENSEYAAQLVQEIAAREGLAPEQVTLHSDNGAPMKGATLLATLHTLGIMPSFSRPAVSNDNPYSESYVVARFMLQITSNSFLLLRFSILKNT